MTKPATTRTRITLTTLKNARKGGRTVILDTEIPGFALRYGSKRAFWTVTYSPHGMNAATGKRWGATRLELGDVGAVTLPEARRLALEAKAAVRAGRDPQREKTAARTTRLAARQTKVMTAAEALLAYETALMVKRKPKEATRRQALGYARKAIRLLGTERKALGAIDVEMVREMLDGLDDAGASDAERRHVFGGLTRFLCWCRKEGVIEASPCDGLESEERPNPGRARDNAPHVEALRKVWRALEGEAPPLRDLTRFLLLMPLRLNEAAGLRWSEIDLERGWIRIDGGRMKNGEPHELPISEGALEILVRRRGEKGPADLVFPSPESGRVFQSWTRLTNRVRRAIGHDALARDRQFRWHDVRRSFVTVLAEEFDEAVLDAMLAHRRKGVAGVYQKQKYLNRRPAVMARWATMLLDEKPASAANVISLRQASAS
jgi:integrase